MRKLCFEVDNIDVKEQIEDSQFVRARARIFASGDNAHELPVLETALHDAEDTIYQKPLVWKYSEARQDATAHERDQVPCGFVPSHGANVSYERTDDGRLFFYCDILIWTLYSGKILEVFQNSDDTKSVSVEIAVLETEEDENNDNQESISKYSYLAITVLGDHVNPAIPGAEMEITQYSVEKDKVERILKESYSDDKNKSGEVFNSSDDQTRVNLEEEVEVVFNKEEFAKSYNLTATEIWDALWKACRSERYVDEEGFEIARYAMLDYDKDNVYAYDRQEDKLYAIPFELKDGEGVLDFDKKKYARLTYLVEEEDAGEQPQVVDFAKDLVKDELEKEYSDVKDKAEKYDELEQDRVHLEAQFEDTKKELSELKAEHSQKETEIENLKQENKDLLAFKQYAEEEERKQKIEFAINNVKDDLTKQQINEWREKVKEFESIEEFGNALKAFAYENHRGKTDKESVVKMGLPQNNGTEENNTDGSVWEKIGN